MKIRWSEGEYCYRINLRHWMISVRLVTVLTLCSEYFSISNLLFNVLGIAGTLTNDTREAKSNSIILPNCGPRLSTRFIVLKTAGYHLLMMIKCIDSYKNTCCAGLGRYLQEIMHYPLCICKRRTDLFLIKISCQEVGQLRLEFWCTY